MKEKVKQTDNILQLPPNSRSFSKKPIITAPKNQQGNTQNRNPSKSEVIPENRE